MGAPRQNKMLQKSVREGKNPSLKKIINNSSFNSLKHIQANESFFVKLIWLCVNIFFIGFAITLNRTLWEDITNNPTVTSLERSNYPVAQVHFPGVSICNLNKISKKKAENLAVFISEKTGTNVTTINKYIKTLGNFYDFEADNIREQLEFQQILEISSQFQLNELLKNLAPSCEDLLIHCSWKNQEVNCTDIFQMRLTFEGYCCIFNYIKNTSEVLAKNFLNNSVQFGQAGLHRGLTVELKNDLDDYFYTKVASVGTNIHIFNPTDYADKNSGSLTEQLVGLSTQFLLQLDVSGVHTVQDATEYPVDKRQYYFPHERKTSFGDYSESDCLIDCKIASMVALCDCVPFMIPQNQNRVCGLSDIQCLSRYKVKWEVLTPSDSLFNENLLREFNFGLDCKHRCYPVCDSFLYSTFTNSVPINPTFGNNSLINIFYNSHKSAMFKQDVRYYWFEIISNIGGIYGVTLGISVITILEFIVFCIYKIHNCNYFICDHDCLMFCKWRF